jgi:glycosyltransferase involved in cell wall biosynthesis
LYCTTLHDVVPLFYANEYLGDPRVRRWYEQKLADVKASDVVLTVSHASKADIVERLAIPEHRVVVTENGYDSAMFYPAKPSEEVRARMQAKYGIRRNFVFYVGGNDKHKNIHRLLAAFALIPNRQELELVLGGKEFPSDPGIRDELAHLNLVGNVVMPGFVDDEDLPDLFRMCELFVFPSTHEGFGLPVLEAMACGAPVVGSNASSIKEIIANPRALFDPMDEQDMSAKMLEALSYRTFRADLIDAGIRRASHYSWSRTAEELIALFDRLELRPARERGAEGDPIDEVARELSSLTPKLSQQALLRVARSVAESLPVPSREIRRKLLLDVSSVVITDHRSGIQRVTRAISAELLKSPPSDYSVDLVYTTPHQQNFRFANRYMRETFGAGRPSHDEEVEFHAGDILLFLDLHPGVAISHREYTKQLRNRGVRVYHVVYDILPLTHPDSFWPELCREFTTWAEALGSSDGAICISRAVAAELKPYVAEFADRRFQPFKVGAFHLGADIDKSAPSMGLPPNAAELLAAFALRPTFLMVGTVEPRKGILQTLKAFESLWDGGADLNLVIVGRLGWRMHDTAQTLTSHSQHGSRLFWLQDISDEFLVALYQKATCLIAASEGEGFGLPLIEAAQHQIPIFARDLPVFREVAGDHAYYFPDSKEPAALAASINSWLEAHRAALHPRSDRMPWLKWHESAKQLLEPILSDKWEYLVHGAGAFSLGSTLRFDSDRLEWRGFGVPEREFRWTNGVDPEIAFVLGKSTGPTCLSILCSPLGSQRVSISLGADEIFNGVVEEDPALIVCALPRMAPGQHILRFRLPDARMPTERDRRLLSLAIRELQIFERLPPLPDESAATHESHCLRFYKFSPAEPNFRWSDDTCAWMVFDWKGPAEDVALELRFKTLGRQRVSLGLNGEPLRAGEFEGDDVRLRAPRAALRPGPNVLRFDLPLARMPSNGDLRLLAIAFRRVEVSRTT